MQIQSRNAEHVKRNPVVIIGVLSGGFRIAVDNVSHVLPQPLNALKIRSGYEARRQPAEVERTMTAQRQPCFRKLQPLFG